MISFLQGVHSSAAALEAERTRLEIISQNIANANTSRGLDGQPYRRQMVVFESMLQQAGAPTEGSAVHVSRIIKDPSPPRMIFNQGHPDANADGFVAMPNVNIHEEMADMIVASRAFEANLAVIRNSKQLALQSLSIGKR